MCEDLFSTCSSKWNWWVTRHSTPSYTSPSWTRSVSLSPGLGLCSWGKLLLTSSHTRLRGYPSAAWRVSTRVGRLHNGGFSSGWWIASLDSSIIPPPPYLMNRVQLILHQGPQLCLCSMLWPEDSPGWTSFPTLHFCLLMLCLCQETIWVLAKHDAGLVHHFWTQIKDCPAPPLPWGVNRQTARCSCGEINAPWSNL